MRFPTKPPLISAPSLLSTLSPYCKLQKELSSPPTPSSDTWPTVKTNFMEDKTFTTGHWLINGSMSWPATSKQLFLRLSLPETVNKLILLLLLKTFTNSSKSLKITFQEENSWLVKNYQSLTFLLLPL